MSSQPRPRFGPAAAGQRGQALILALLIVGAAIAALLYFLATPAKLKIERDRKTAAALAQAKAALIGFAAGVDLFDASLDQRPGDFPCPDFDNDGTADTSCAGAALGRFPWKRLGLPDLRDGDGERLWYAVSSNFKNNPRSSCTAPGQPGCLNSDSRGTITIRDRNGTVINNGSNPDAFNPSGVIAVIIAPGSVLRRQGAAAAQDRSCTVGVNCDANERCTTTPASATPKCNPVNYLDILSGTEDNADFADGSATNGLINGDIFDAGGNPIVNDRVLTITYADLMPLLERRVAKEALNCLEAYAGVAQNRNRYPWASSMAASSGADPYPDTLDVRYGRIPDTLINTAAPTAMAQKLCPPPGTPSWCMSDTYPATCSLIKGSWWKNWKDVVLYGVAEAYRPEFDDTAKSAAPGGPCGTCLTVNTPSPVVNVRVVVFVAGKRLSGVAGGQPRSSADKSNAANYAEGENDEVATPNTLYTRQQPATTTFNDVLLYR